MIRVAVTGACGRMGGLIVENVINSEDLELVCAIDITHVGEDVGEVNGLGRLGLKVEDASNIDNALQKAQPDVLIDFTIAQAAVKNVISSASKKIRVVVGTTGFTEEQMRLIKNAIKENAIAGVISPNFSVGVNVFWGLIAEAAKWLYDYDVEIIEAHHNKKKDAPSGTAMKAADILSKALRIEKLVYGRHGISPRGKEIGVHAIRGGDIVGEHVVLFAGEGERIEIKHIANSRQAFARGAIKAARWVVNAPPGMYEMRDVLGM